MAPEAVTLGTGWACLHLFFQAGTGADRRAISSAVSEASGGDHQVVSVSLLGHKADLGFVAIGPDPWRLRTFQTSLVASGLRLVDSYVSMTELSEYSEGIPEEMKQARLFPNLPPEGLPAFCFYPMSKRRAEVGNWYTLPYDQRRDLMYEHGATGRKFRGRVLQLVTGSTGVDDHEWGVTLFAAHFDDLKEVVYTMRFDEASAVYGEFGRFVSGMVAPLDDVLDGAGVR